MNVKQFQNISRHYRRLINTLMIITGTICVGIGIIGIFLPILPTTPFLLAAAACYARGSNRFYHGLLNNRIFGKYIKNYRDGHGVSLKIKIFTIIVLWITISYSSFVVPVLVIKVILTIIAVIVTVHIILIPTYHST